jgi:hypothetical protein
MADPLIQERATPSFCLQKTRTLDSPNPSFSHTPHHQVLLILSSKSAGIHHFWHVSDSPASGSWHWLFSAAWNTHFLISPLLTSSSSPAAAEVSLYEVYLPSG